MILVMFVVAVLLVLVLAVGRLVKFETELHRGPLLPPSMARYFESCASEVVLLAWPAGASRDHGVPLALDLPLLTTLLDAPNGSPRASGNITLEGDAYAAWGSDDAYLYTYTAQQLGLTIVEIVPDAPPAPPVVEPPAPVDAAASVVASSDEAADAADGGTQ